MTVTLRCSIRPDPFSTQETCHTAVEIAENPVGLCRAVADRLRLVADVAASC